MISGVWGREQLIEREEDGRGDPTKPSSLLVLLLHPV